MSKIIRNYTGCRGISHLVETEDGNLYVVSSVNLVEANIPSYLPFETAVFRWNRRQNRITNFLHLYRRQYADEQEMMTDHEEICANLEKYIHP